MSRIVIAESLGVSDAVLRQLMTPFEAEGHCFTVFERTDDQGALEAEVREADVVMLANMPFPERVIESAGNLKFINIAFTGVDHVGMAAARRRGIAVSNASGYSNEAVAELTLAMALSLLRNIREVEVRCRAGETKVGLIGRELKGKTVGIIGLGRIGRRSAELFHAFACPVLAARHGTTAKAPAYVRWVDEAELLRLSDIVVLHCPLTAETRGLIDRSKLEMMKKSAILLNVARGPVVVAEDLAWALNHEIIAGAGVDVFDQEPPLNPETEPLLQAKHCLLTPHVAFASEESMRLRAEIVFANLRAWLDGCPQNRVE